MGVPLELPSFILQAAQLSVSNNHCYCGMGSGAIKDLVYSHPIQKQCNYEPDLSEIVTAEQLGISKIVFGTYMGTDRNGSQTITLGFRPKVVLVFGRSGSLGSQNESMAGLALDGYPTESENYTGITITSSGFRVTSAGMNYANGMMFNFDDSDYSPYRYIAFA